NVKQRLTGFLFALPSFKYLYHIALIARHIVFTAKLKQRLPAVFRSAFLVGVVEPISPVAGIYDIVTVKYIQRHDQHHEKWNAPVLKKIGNSSRHCDQYCKENSNAC